MRDSPSRGLDESAGQDKMFVVSDLGVWDGGGFTDDFGRAVLYATGAEWISAVEAVAKTTGVHCVGGYVASCS